MFFWKLIVPRQPEWQAIAAPSPSPHSIGLRQTTPMQPSASRTAVTTESSGKNAGAAYYATGAPGPFRQTPYQPHNQARILMISWLCVAMMFSHKVVNSG